ncbi:MAG TPA: O-acetyl-ADP-ribose deacetylase [Gammaproteobacteria bacterium]
MIEIVVADITTLRVDAVVNAASESLLGGGGVDGAIHRAAGPELLEFNRTLGGCPPGKARVSPGFRLPAKWIVHTVGTVWKGGSAGESAVLESAYRSSFRCALEKGVRRIAFPAISTGVYGYPKDEASRVALGVMREYERDFERIVVCCFSEADAAVYRAAMGELRGD